MKQQSVSVVIAAFAPQRRWLREAVSSALAQGGCETEVVVVDDGSPQAIAAMFDGIESERLVTVRTPHRGVGRARDAGFAKSSGEYLRFLDADDVLPRDSTARLLQCAEQASTPLAVGATQWCDEGLVPLFDWRASCPTNAVRSVLLLRSTPMLPSLLFPRSVVEAVGHWDEQMTVGEDWDFILRALELAPVSETKSVVTLYRQHGGSASCDGDAAWRDTRLAVDRYFQRNPGERAQFEHKVEAMMDLLAAELARPAAPWRERRFWRAFTRDPSAIRTAYTRVIQPRVGALRARGGVGRQC